MSEKIRLIDVGARGGIHSRWIPFYEMLDVLAFEPDKKECAALNLKKYPYPIRFLPTALGAQNNQQAILYICKQPGCSSVLKPNNTFCNQFPYGPAMEVIDEYPVILNRMDMACADFQPDIIKIDIQGTELDVLKGAGQLLEDTLAIELEVGFVPQYIGQALFPEIDIFLREQGFMLRGLRRTYWRTKATQRHAFGGQLIHGDAFYIQTDRINCPKGHIILSAYHQYDLLAYYGATQLIPKKSMFIRFLSLLLSRYPNTNLRRLIDKIRPNNATDWHDPDFF